LILLLCIGEILADMIGEEKNGITTYERKAGGAPSTLPAH